MPEQQRRRGRPEFTREQRIAASNASFDAALPRMDGNGCQPVKRTHMVGYNFQRVRTRTFAWDFWHPESPLGPNSRIVMKCKTAGCVAREHMMRVDVIGEGTATEPEVTVVVRPENELVIDFDSFEKNMVNAIEKSKGGDLYMGIAKNWWHDNPVDEASDEAALRMGIIEKYVTTDLEEYDAIRGEWGLYRSE